MGAPDVILELLAPSDVVAVAQCIAIDAESFPYASAAFGTPALSASVWTARDANTRRVVGFVAGRRREPVLHLEGLAVESAWRRRGIGSALVREAVAHAAGEGLDLVTLHVSVGNRAALALYQREGFIVRRRLPGFYPPAAFEGEVDAYEMIRPAAEPATAFKPSSGP